MKPGLHRFCHANSSGKAAGNMLEEAILQGLFELVERDSAALWWYNRVQRPGVDLASFGEPYFQAFRAHCVQQGRGVWVLALTSNLTIPVFAAVSRCYEWLGRQTALWVRCAYRSRMVASATA